MPCHVTIRRKLSQTHQTIRPAPEYSAIDCHGHGRRKTITPGDLNALTAVSFARRNVAPYISPILDLRTLALVCKDLGITGRAIPKVINGRQYIIFKGYPGLRTLFPSTIFFAKNRKIITMAIGALGIKHMVRSGAILTICITVPLTILECFLEDRATMTDLIGNIALDLAKAGIPAILAAIAGLWVGGATTIVSFPIIVAIGVGFFAGVGLELGLVLYS